MNQQSSTSACQQDDGEEPRKLQKSDQCELLPVVDSSAESELPKSTVGFDKLPDEVILEILSYATFEDLMEVHQNVCTRWKRLCHDPVLWRNSYFCTRIYRPGDGTATMIKQNPMPHLRNMELLHDVEPSVIDAVCDSCPGLTFLNIGCCKQISCSLLEKLVKKCPNIRTLCISHQLLCDERKSEAITQLHHLQSLTVKVDSITDGKRIHLTPLTNGCPKLVSFGLSSATNIRKRELEYFLTVKCKALTEVTLPWAIYTRHSRRCVVTLLKDCTSLNYLELTECTVISDEAPEVFTTLGRLSNIRTLIINELMNCPVGVPDLAFKSGGLSRLQVLKINCSIVYDSAVVAACKHCPELKVLDLYSCHNLTDAALRRLCCLTKLETLNLNLCSGLRGEAIGYVAQVTTLRELFIQSLDMKYLVPGLDRILDMTSLETLSFSYAVNVSIFPFDRLAGKLVRLRVLHLERCIDESVAKRLQEQMPSLKVHFYPVENFAPSWYEEAAVEEDGGIDWFPYLPEDDMAVIEEDWESE